MKLNKILFAMSSLALTGMFVSCSVDDYIANKDEIMKQLGEFSFQTSDDVMLDINYGPLASRALVEVYGDNPLADATENDETPKGETVFTTFLDENGRFTGEVEIPAHVDHLYFYTGAMGAPQLMDAEVKNNLVKVQRPQAAASSRASRAVSDDKLQVRKLTSSEVSNTSANFYTIVGTWDNYGNVEDPNHLIDEGTLTSNDVRAVGSYFWKGAKEKPTMNETLKQIHRNLLVDNVNMVVQEQYEEDGVTYDVESAQVWFTFLTEYAWNENTVGYYFFDRSNPPQKASDIKKKFIILPNSSQSAHPPYQSVSGCEYKFTEANAPASLNQRVQLLYVDDNGKASVNFPPGVEIGFFLMSNGFRSGSWSDDAVQNNGKTYYYGRKNSLINANATTYYSDYKLNTGASPQKRYVACRLANGTVVYGVEDSTDESYDDMMFTVTASPNKAIHTEGGSTLTEIPSIEEEAVYTTDKSTKYTYAFEDLWPDGGDYDLNDVVVRHEREVTKDQNNMVSKVLDKFTFEISHTTNDADAFAFQVPAGHQGDRYELSQGWYEEETHSFFFAEDVHTVNGQTLTLTREFEHPVKFDDIKAESNPFIVNTTKGPDCRSNGRIEIHLTKQPVTSKGMTSKDQAKAWYISEDGLYPYAIKVTTLDFEPCDPGVKIGSQPGAYPDYIKWAESHGLNNTSWYKNK